MLLRVAADAMSAWMNMATTTSRTKTMSEMQAGRELDAIVAERIMGWRWYTRPLAPLRWLGPPNAADGPPNSAGAVALCDKADKGKEAEDGWWLEEDRYRDGFPRVPHYSTEISAAWEVAEKLHLTVTPGIRGWRAARCNWSQSGETTAVGMTNHRQWVEAETAPLAICLAAAREARHS